jgi:hypothetical protein
VAVDRAERRRGIAIVKFCHSVSKGTEILSGFACGHLPLSRRLCAGPGLLPPIDRQVGTAHFAAPLASRGQRAKEIR